ncbi:MAG: M16 family metallopeptidase [Byssovorax sp.]
MRHFTPFLLALALTACEAATPPVTPDAVVLTPAPVATTPSSAAPAADPATVTDGDVTVAWVNGLQILVKRIPGAELAAGHLYIKGGVRNWSAADAGLEELALSTAASGGTEKLDKDAFARRLAALGSGIGASSGNDYASVRMTSIVKEWDTTFGLLADTFLHPALPAAELETHRQRGLAGLRHEQDSPDGRLRFAMHQRVFAGHPYENRSTGTLESLGKVQIKSLGAHLARLRQTSRLVFVATGDLDPAHVIDQVRATFGALPRGDYRETQLPRVAFDKPSLAVVEQKLPTNYCQSVFVAPGYAEPDYAQGLMAMSVLTDRLFDEIRTKRNLSYAPSARLSSNLSIGLGVLYVTAVDADAARKVTLDEVKSLQSELVSERELTSAKSTFLTGYLMENETMSGQASMLGRALLLGNDWHLARTLPEKIKAVTSAEIQAFAKKYAGRLQTVVLGDPARIDRGLFGSM